MNLLLCVDKSSLEYYKGGRPIRYKSFWTRINGKKYRERIKKNVLDGEVENIATIFFPFLKRKASIVGQTLTGEDCLGQKRVPRMANITSEIVE
jgi:hypothetical protein